ncbi:toll/interleukin-1 receptor domain-containing protein [Patulibacter sp. NPDC049589]|uniref:toll/interleukin-1 receptor domain-containing protein n=1 Tax=Patulibacter sp. NPDC049589 TaxID=3154731 RepID=UPI003433A36D
MSGFDAAKWQREMRAAQRKAEQAWKRQVDQANRETQRQVDAHNRKVDQHNRKIVADHNREAERHNRRVEAANRQEVGRFNREVARVNAHNEKVVSGLNRQLRSAASGPRYTLEEQGLADRVQAATLGRDDREWDVFLSYARLDGGIVGDQLRQQLEHLGVRVWFDELAIVPGQSQSLQMDKGLQRARAGLVLLTPAYIAGRFWTERELGALLRKSTLIPVLHNVTFEQVSEYSGILPDLAGFETARDSLDVIAQKIAAAVLPEADAAAA